MDIDQLRLPMHINNNIKNMHPVCNAKYSGSFLTVSNSIPTKYRVKQVAFSWEIPSQEKFQSGPIPGDFKSHGIFVKKIWNLNHGKIPKIKKM